jgi:hypothetical protein
VILGFTRGYEEELVETCDGSEEWARIFPKR